MWISELSRRSAVPVATVKYYLREGLLPPGEAVGATRADYDESHVRRLRLVRALVEVGGLRLDQVRGVLAAVDDETLPLHSALGAAHTGLSHVDDAPPVDVDARRRVDRLVRRWAWRVGRDSAHRDALARSLAALADLDVAPSDELLDLYAVGLHIAAEREVGSVPHADRGAATERAVVGTLLLEPALLAIRRLAQEDVSARTLRGRGER